MKGTIVLISQASAVESWQSGGDGWSWLAGSFEQLEDSAGLFS
jgi:hypothetical protein